ncbi:short-chain dehydrogenase/reductase family 16C member 6 [Tribolium castaneum]|uniref:Dehydrogenase/reductase SDR family protein 7-like n=1 Tax=Tribolium castaneum TaxID=7070 RepID=D6WW87_TRICA|nr:PREDICTED: short-chain dehydrogenase/reductase family 16C member 6 [Tribolium castaneum]EFA08169.2 Dehydrogenase/reductase SDR family protein 7-like [Tribolium castaneum]|eukprot:XP_971706.1 PREDICTED: short-chain dehydrogenase/reductase family 16C member 6 [Tribolium castaneum]
MHPYVRRTIRATLASLEWLRITTLRVTTRIIELIVLSWLSVYYIAEALILTFTPAFLRRQKTLRGKIVLVTGGAGGVGQELALRLARQKARVVIWDNNEKALEKVREKIESEGYKVHTYPVDVTDRENVYKYADIVKSDIGHIDVLINNAGIVCGQTFLEIPDYMIEKTFKVNILSHYWTTKAFLPNMIKTGKGHIVTIGSLTGLLGTYKCTDYSASKHATIGFHESLLIELKTHGHHQIKMTLVCPYFINTGMFAGCKPRNMNMLEPKDVAKRIITAIRREEVYVTMPAFSRFVLPVKNFIPAKLNWALVYKVIQGPQSMMGMRNFQEVEAA